jgi:hypothetical protein
MMFFIVALIVACAAGEYLHPISKLFGLLEKVGGKNR